MQLNIFIVLLGIGIFAYFATNAGEKPMFRPGLKPALTVVIICLIGYILWPWIAPLVVWAIPSSIK